VRRGWGVEAARGYIMIVDRFVNEKFRTLFFLVLLFHRRFLSISEESHCPKNTSENIDN
jgi:hypothetical protein